MEAVEVMEAVVVMEAVEVMAVTVVIVEVDMVLVISAMAQIAMEVVQIIIRVFIAPAGIYAPP